MSPSLDPNSFAVLTGLSSCGFLADGYGRRICIFIGCLLVLVGTAIQTPAKSMGQFIGGRFVLGFGASIASAAGPAYTVELAHPAYRGTMAGMCRSSNPIKFRPPAKVH